MHAKPFRKDDAGKTRFDLLDPWFLLEIAEILTQGAAHYGDENWKKADPSSAKTRYTAALHRHLNARARGEIRDPDSGRRHLAHAACCTMFLLWFERKAGMDAPSSPGMQTSQKGYQSQLVQH